MFGFARRTAFAPLFFAIALAGGMPDLSSGWAAEPVGLSDEELAEGWISLFDGQSLYGWRAACEADWQVKDGAIVVTAGEVGLLRTTTQFCDYVLRLEYRCGPRTNSGVFLRTSPRPQDPGKDCYELNIAPPDNPFPTGSLVKRQRADQVPWRDGWQTLEVTADGGQFTVACDGQPVLTYTDPRPLGRGFIGLQHNEGEIAFRNIRLKPLGMQSIFNGQNLDGWKAYPKMDSRFRVTEQGELHVENGPGQLETVGSYGDFVLQLESRTNGENLNSGIFFRCIPGDKMMGYECQIHHGYVDGDRSRPADCGTGGIFRRQDARRVVSDDFQWCHITLIAEGPHMATWVDGYQVCDWTDGRKPDQNPRRGLRLQPGTIMIQGHDPTTDLSFRNLRIVEMAQRWK
jgi:hypothetical protein